MNGASHTAAMTNNDAYDDSGSGEHTLDTVFVHLNCQSTLGLECLCAPVFCDCLCTHSMFVSLCVCVRARMLIYRMCVCRQCPAGQSIKAVTSFLGHCSSYCPNSVFIFPFTLPLCVIISAEGEVINSVFSMRGLLFMCKRSDLGIITLMNRLLSGPD